MHASLGLDAVVHHCIPVLASQNLPTQNVILIDIVTFTVFQLTSVSGLKRCCVVQTRPTKNQAGKTGNNAFTAKDKDGYISVAIKTLFHRA